MRHAVYFDQIDDYLEELRAHYTPGGLNHNLVRMTTKEFLVYGHPPKKYVLEFISTCMIDASCTQDERLLRFRVECGDSYTGPVPIETIARAQQLSDAVRAAARDLGLEVRGGEIQVY